MIAAARRTTPRPALDAAFDAAPTLDSHNSRSIAGGRGVFRHHTRAGGGRKSRPCSIPLPAADSGLSPLACRLAEGAFSIAIGDPPFPVAEWSGPCPRLKSADLFFAADRLLEDGDGSSLRAMLAAIRAVAKHYLVK